MNNKIMPDDPHRKNMEFFEKMAVELDYDRDSHHDDVRSFHYKF
jgi:hypothetical protein